MIDELAVLDGYGSLAAVFQTAEEDLTHQERNDIDIYGTMTPAKAVGGDLFDFFIRDEKFFFCIGDVSGKGVPASLFMSVTINLFNAVSEHETMPGKIMTQMNELIFRRNDTCMFVKAKIKKCS